MQRGIALHHQRQGQLFTAITRQGHADQAATMAGHEVDIFRTHVAGRHDQVTLVFAVLVIHQDDHATVANILDNFFCSVK